MAADCTLVILTYKGFHHLELLLPTVQTAIEASSAYSIDVLIVDNGPDDGSEQWVKNNFPSFRYEYSPVNDYLFSLNRFVQRLESKFAFILNNDMKLHPDVINVALPIIIKDESLFAVTCKIMDWDGTYSASGVRVLNPSLGWARNYWLDMDEEECKYTLNAGGGAAIFRTSMFNALGGFDPLFRPAYYEDTDLSHRAWQRGWKIVYAPKAVLYHREGGTIKEQYKRDKLTQQISKNQIVWMARNARYPGFLPWFLVMLPVRLLTNWRVDKNSNIALWKALPKLPKALFKRLSTKRIELDDRQIIGYLDKPYTGCN